MEVVLIDYEKLKEEIDLMHKRMCVQKDEQLNEDAKALCVSICHSLENIYNCSNKLKELSNPQPKYKVGDKVWILDFGLGFVETMICEVDTSLKKMYYEDMYQQWHEEKELYPSREALINAQIEYWQKLKDESVTDCHQLCEHQWIGNDVRITHCKKCGEFYR